MLLAGQSSYESSSPSEALSVPSVLGYALHHGAPIAPVAIAPPESASVGPLALGDVNGDGRLDLFVGARVIPGTGCSWRGTRSRRATPSATPQSSAN